MNKTNFPKMLRIFFIIFAFSLLVQITFFLKERATLALDFFHTDFRIVVVLNNATVTEAKGFSAKLLTLPGVLEVSQLSNDDILGYIRQGVSGRDLKSFLPKEDFLPTFYELFVSQEVFLNPSFWATQNIAPLLEDAESFFNQKEANIATYLNGLISTVNIFLILVCFCVVAFGFFVESYTTVDTDLSIRLWSCFTGFLGYVIACGFVYIIFVYLKALPIEAYNILNWQQGIGLIVSILFSWSFAKWGKF